MAKSSGAGSKSDQTADGRLRFRVEGPDAAPALLLSNSLGTTLEMWDAQVPEWSRAYRVIRYDTRGHGGSSVPSGDYTIDDLGHDAIAVLDATGVTTSAVCGISLGGLTAMWLALNVPDRITALVAANTAARIGTVSRWTERMAMVRNDGMQAVADKMMGTWFTEEFRRRQPDVVARFHRMLSDSPSEGYLSCCAALRDADIREALHAVRAPTLVIAGQFDASTPLEGAEDIRGRIAQSSLITLPTAHLSNIECAYEFVHAVNLFLTNC